MIVFMNRSLLTITLMIGILILAVPSSIQGQKLQEKKSSSAVWGKSSGGFQLSVWAKKESFSHDEPIWTHISLKNVFSKTVMIEQTDPWYDYSIEIQDEAGKKVPLTEEGKKLKSKAKDDLVVRHMPIYLAHGEVVNDRLMINSIFDMKTGGTYSVTVRRKVHKYNKKWLGVVEVISNIITIKVQA